jgi:hypothetical protein
MESVQVSRTYYAALPATPGDEVTVHLYDHDVEILDAAGQLLRRHLRSYQPGHFEMLESDWIFNPSRETLRLPGRVAKLGPHSLELARNIFVRLGRPGQKALYGMSNLPRRYAKKDIENAAKRVLTLSQPSYHALKRILEHHAAETERRAAVAAAAERDWDENVLSCALAAIAASKGFCVVAEAVLELNSDTAQEFLKWHLDL